MSNDSLPPPGLEERFQQPPGWRWHTFRNGKGKAFRFGSVYPPSRIPAAVVIGLPGLSEFAEKYFEVAHDLLARNLAFWVMDWHGQGQSDRPLKNPHKRHSSGFGEDVEDLHFFIMEYVKHSAVHPDVGRIPLVMLAHSMGANIGLHYLHRHPGIFQCAAMTAPLTGVLALRAVPGPLRRIVTGLFRMAAGRAYIPGGGNYRPDRRELALLTHDSTRGKVFHGWCGHDPRLQVGGVTFGWLDEAVASCARLHRRGVPESIQTPCLIALAGKEGLVDNAAARRLARRLPHARLVEYQEAGHEILMERDDIRNAFLAELDALIREHVIENPQSLKPF